MAGTEIGLNRSTVNLALVRHVAHCLGVLGLVLLILGSGSAKAMDPGRYVQSLDFGTVDWTQGVILAEAEGSAPEAVGTREKGFALARRQAIIEARQRLFKTVREIRIQGTETVERLLQQRPELESGLRELVQTRTRIRTERLQEGTRVWAETRLDLQAVSRVCLRDDVWIGTSPEPQQDIADQNGSMNGSGTFPTAKSYTGLVIDARGTGVKPALIFQVFNQQGHVVIGPGQVEPEAGKTKGIVRFFSKLDAAGIEDRVGADPMRLRAAGAAPGQGGDALISEQDALRLVLARRANDFVASCRVAVVLRKSDDSRVIEYTID